MASVLSPRVSAITGMGVSSGTKRACCGMVRLLQRGVEDIIVVLKDIVVGELGRQLSRCTKVYRLLDDVQRNNNIEFGQIGGLSTL